METHPPTDDVEDTAGEFETLAEREYAVWLAEADDGAPRRQPVHLELTAEHHLMRIVLRAMDREWRRIERGEPLRVPFWAGVVAFNGDFVHSCHRVKEEHHLIPALIAHAGLSQTYIDAVDREHQRAKKLTLGIRDAVEQGEWETLTRLVAMYVSFLEPHMHHEEVELFGRLSEELPPNVRISLRAAFTAAEAEAMGKDPRPKLVERARELARMAGVDASL